MTILLGLIALAIAAVSYSLYIRDVLRGRTKPHGFTWGTWAVLGVFIFMEQLTHQAGPGAWPTAFIAIAATVICILSITYGERNITALDWLSLGAVCIVGLVWLQGVSASISVLLASLAFLLGFIPTVRKSLRRADQETAATYALNSVKFLVALCALQNFSFETATYPAVLMTANGLFATFLFTHHSPAIRKQQKRRNHV